MSKKILLTIMLLAPSFAFASWQIAGSPVRTPGNQPIVDVKDIPARYQVNPKYTFYLSRGRLKQNFKRYAKRIHWHLRWHAPNYTVFTSATFSGNSMYEVIGLILKNYPLEAFYNTKTRTINVWVKRP